MASKPRPKKKDPLEKVPLARVDAYEIRFSMRRRMTDDPETEYVQDIRGEIKKRGLIVGQVVVVAGKRATFYSLTPEGREALGLGSP